MTGIAQHTFDATSGEFFGFTATAGAPATPNLASPGIAYATTTYVSGSAGGEITHAVATSEFNPNKKTDVIVTPDPESTAGDFNDYEGLWAY